jgi:hypothetical protein
MSLTDCKGNFKFKTGNVKPAYLSESYTEFKIFAGLMIWRDSNYYLFNFCCA